MGSVSFERELQTSSVTNSDQVYEKTCLVSYLPITLSPSFSFLGIPMVLFGENTPLGPASCLFLLVAG